MDHKMAIAAAMIAGGMFTPGGIAYSAPRREPDKGPTAGDLARIAAAAERRARRAAKRARATKPKD